jgi:hypothetical protein
MTPPTSPFAARLSAWTLITTAAFAAAGCESPPADVDLGDPYTQSPIGYVPPYEERDLLPVVMGPQPVILTGGSPTIRFQDQANVIDLVALENGFQPAEFVVSPGQVVTVRLTNRSAVTRGLRVELPDSQATVQDIGPGESRVIVFTAPMQPGTYIFHSSVGDVQAGRIQGRLIVGSSP